MLFFMESRKKKIKHHKVEFVLRKDRADAHGFCPLLLKITYGSHRTFFSMPKEMTFSVNGKDELISTVLDEQSLEKVTYNNDRKRLSDSERIVRDFLHDYRLKALSIAKTIIPFEREPFIERFFAQHDTSVTDSSLTIPDVLQCFRIRCDELKKDNKHSTAAAYLDVYHSFIAFLLGEIIPDKPKGGYKRKSEERKKKEKQMTLPFNRITVDFLKKYEAVMIKAGNSRGTVGKYAKILRTMYRKYYKEGMSLYPFGKDGYTIPSARNNKRALDTADIKKILDYIPQNDYEYFAVGLWCTSYYCGGLNTADIIRLRIHHFILDKEGGAITEVIRQKTRGQREETKIEIVLSARQWKYVSAYLIHFEKDFDRICQTDGAERFRRHKTLIGKINSHLRIVSQKLEIPIVTTYFARHSAATQLLRSSVPIAHISEMLGHKSITTTQMYLGSFDMEQKREFAKKLEL